MSKKTKVLVFIIIIIAIGFFSVRYYVYHGGQRDIQSEETAFTVTSSSIVAEFTSNTEASNKKYLEKPVAISGTVTSVNAAGVILDNTVNCIFATANPAVKVNQKVIVKGRVVGFDDLFGELKLDQCNLSTNK
ncbi:hypothetical protein EZL74_07480 [Flavobacterium silvisoli]|uniref:tRNA_anti-like n=1 Tax=Flavobacterium silvisoli TaxID=2529433 RepID=A0A4Q9YZI3_9FLAO|nr:hypothetical protein [Flavobacterium silvisoli]TBX69211.1 hypothetical protein EZL74_07480 [Flavobacterium silvisoli]